MSTALALLFLAAFLWALISNRDLFSPAKFYLFSFLVFHVGALESWHAPEVWLLMMLVLLVGSVAVLFEALQPLPRLMHRTRGRGGISQEDPHTFHWLWLLSLPAILSQAYMIQFFGGLAGYLTVLAFRVVEWRGLGWAKTVIATMTTLNLVYLAVGLSRARSRAWWCGYALHFVIVLALGLLSGSRSSILNVIAMQMFTYHYVRRAVNVRTAAVLAVSLVLSGLVLGVVRDSFRVGEDDFKTGLADADQILSIPTLKYGVTPLDLLVEAGPLKLAYGSTLLSLFTNAVPRNWWPDKPDTGGVFFTKEYTGDEWEGASNLTPTILGEAVINFGWLVGIPVFLIAYPALLYFVVRRYRRTQLRLRHAPGAVASIDFVTYLLWMWAVVALMTGEVTNVILTTVLTGLLPAHVARFLIKPRTTARHARRGSGFAAHTTHAG